MSWISVKDELPEKDGDYEVCNILNYPYDIIGVCYYDGYGFLYNHIYRTVDYWRHITIKNKVYGKIAK